MTDLKAYGRSGEMRCGVTDNHEGVTGIPLASFLVLLVDEANRPDRWVPVCSAHRFHGKQLRVISLNGGDNSSKALPEGSVHLGDGAYASFDGWYTLLWAQRSDGRWHRVGLEPDGVAALVAFAKRHGVLKRNSDGYL